MFQSIVLVVLLFFPLLALNYLRACGVVMTDRERLNRLLVDTRYPLLETLILIKRLNPARRDIHKAHMLRRFFFRRPPWHLYGIAGCKKMRGREK